jgi:hypothetical protein
MTRVMVALVLIGCAACGGELASNSTGSSSTPVDFTRYGAYALWPCGPNSPTQSPGCDNLVRRYVSALADTPSCDLHGDSCVRRPIAGFGAADAILCNCTRAVNVGTTQAADSVLTDFYAAGCTIMCCPCPAPPPP